MVSSVNSETVSVANSIERRSPSRSISAPAGTVVASATAPTTATTSAACEADAPSCIAAITCTGIVAPAAIPNRIDGA